MENHFSILDLRTSWTVSKAKRQDTERWTLSRLVGAQYATGDQWRNTSRKNEEKEPKQKQHPDVVWLVMEVKSDAIKSNTA